MIDLIIEKQITEIEECVYKINEIMKELNSKNVEIKILYKDATLNTPPILELWKAIEHIDYLKK